MTQAPLDPRPRASVTAVVVSCGGWYLQRTLAALAGQVRRPDQVVVVDAAREPQATIDRVRPTLPSKLVLAPGGYAEAVAAGVAAAEPTSWLWLLHDDSAPDPNALVELLHTVEVAPSVAIAGCKQHTWSDPPRVLEVGVWTSRGGRRIVGIEDPEVDQGQYDGREDVLAVGTAGALVRRDVWDALGGLDPVLPPFGDGLDLSWRARLAGHRVVVVPTAVVRHARASWSGDRAGWSPRRSARRQRQSHLHLRLVHAPLPVLPLLLGWYPLAGAVRALGRLLARQPGVALGELVAPWVVVTRPAWWRARRRLPRALPRRALRDLQADWTEVWRRARERRLTAAEERRTTGAPSELELRELAALRRRRRGVLALVLVVAAGLTGLAFGPLLADHLAGVRLTGSFGYGTESAGDLWRTLSSGWLDTGFGEPSPPEPLLLVLLPLVALAGDVGRAVAGVMLTAILLATVGAWYAAGAFTRSIWARAAAALAWSALPSFLLAVAQNHLGAVLVHVALPWVVLGVMRGTGRARADAARSGLEGGGVAEVAAPPSGAAIAGAALGMVVVTAAAPVLLPVLAVLLAGVSVAARRWRLLLAGAPALVLHAPVLSAAIGDPRLLVADPLPMRTQAWWEATGWGGDLRWSAVATLAVLGLAAGLGLWRSGTARLAWLAVAAGLAAASVAGATVSGVVAGRTVAASPAPGLSLAGVGLLIAALAALREVDRRVLWVAVAAALVPVAGLGLWSWQHRGGTGVDLRAAGANTVPAVGRQMQQGPDRVRVLLLEHVDDRLVAVVLRHDGPQLTERSRVVNLRALTAPSPPATELAHLAAELSVGAGRDVAPELAGLGIGAVLVPAGDQHSELVGRLDATAGLERMTETTSGVIWRVAGAPAAWLRTLDDDGEAAVPQGDLEADAALVVLAERADDGWRAWVDGRPLPVTDLDWRQAFLARPGALTVSHVSEQPWLPVQLAVLAGTALLALPVRRRGVA